MNDIEFFTLGNNDYCSINEDEVIKDLSRLDFLKQKETNNKTIINFSKEIFVEYNDERSSLKEFIQTEETLDMFLLPIKNSNMSMFEKYMYCYNIVKKFKEYNGDTFDVTDSRDVSKILNNEYMVCAGYVNMLTRLLDRVGISYIKMGVESNSEENLESNEIDKHARLMVKLTDEKYDIDGIFVSDPTWDNNLDEDLYVNILMTLEETSQQVENIKIRNMKFYKQKMKKI